jgi:hypothetical protein
VRERDGMTQVLYLRDCPSGRQQTWVTTDAPDEVLGLFAWLAVKELLPDPVFEFSPDVETRSGYVGLETWLEVGEIAPISATTPPLPLSGVTATSTATVESIVWRPGDGSEVSCEPWGALPTGAVRFGDVGAPCGWVPEAVSAPQYTGTDDLKYHGVIEIVWRGTFTTSRGGAGDLGTAATETAYAYEVREIQTIGVDR